MSEKKSLLKNLSWTTTGMVLYNMAIWVFSALILRMLGPQASGYYGIACSLGNTLYAMSLWGMRSFLVADTDEIYSPDEYRSARFVEILLSVLVGIGIVLFSSYDGTQKEIFLLYTLFKCAEALIEVLDSLAQRRLQMDVNAKSMVIRSILLSVLFYLALKCTHSMHIGFAVLTIASLAVYFLYNLPRVRKIAGFGGKPVINRNVLMIMKKTFPIMAFELLAALVVAIPRLFFERIGSLADLGIYTSIYTMVTFLQLVCNVLIYTFAPYMAKVYHERNMKQFYRYVIGLFGLSALLGLLAEGMVLVLGKPVMSLLFGKEAGMHFGYLYMGILSGVTLSWTWIMSQIFVIRARQNMPLYASLISTLMCVVLSRLLVSGTDCNSMSLVMILTNLSFLAASLILLLIDRRDA